MGFDLASLIIPVDGLDLLTKPFEKEEMDDVVKHMPVDKAPGPDGFNGLFSRGAGTSYHLISMIWLMLFMRGLQYWTTLIALSLL